MPVFMYTYGVYLPGYVDVAIQLRTGRGDRMYMGAAWIQT